MALQRSIMQLHPVWMWRVLCIMPFDVNTGRRSNLLTAYSLLMPSAASLFTVLHIRDAALDWLQLLDVISVNVACFLVIIPSLTVPPPRIKLDPNAGNREILFVVGLHISLWFLEGSAATSAYRVFDTVITGYALQFSTVALGIGIKFAKINRNLDECLSTSIRTEYSRDQFSTGDSGQQVLKALSSVWCQRQGCSDAVLAVSRNQGFQLCTVVASTFVTCVLLTTELVAHLIGRHRIGDGWRPTLARFILVVCRFVLLVRSSSMTANQAENTLCIMRKHFAIRRKQEINLKNQIGTFILQMRKDSTKFRPCGMFDIDLEITSNLLGTLITYVIILLQIQP